MSIQELRNAIASCNMEAIIEWAKLRNIECPATIRYLNIKKEAIAKKCYLSDLGYGEADNEALHQEHREILETAEQELVG